MWRFNEKDCNEHLFLKRFYLQLILHFFIANACKAAITP